MAAFNDGNGQNHRMNAFNAAIELHRLLRDVMNPLVKVPVICGYGLAEGHILMMRLKAKKYKLTSFGVFPGEATNFASKLCDAALCDEILMNESVYNHVRKGSKYEITQKKIDNINETCFSYKLN